VFPAVDKTERPTFEKEIPMKTSVLSTLAMLSLSVVLGPIRLMAQAPIHVSIPFDFSVGEKSFAAGEYNVQRPQPGSLAIQSADGRARMATTVHRSAPNNKPGIATLTFNRYADRYFLSRVSEYDSGWELAHSAVEKELIAKRTEPAKPVSVVASSSR
jgi:hypothetical protein